MKRLSVPQIVILHKALILETGGLDGIRDENMLESAANSPFQTFDGEYVYLSLEEMAAHLGYSIIKDQPFQDGNKRTGMLAMMVFLEMNEKPIKSSDPDIVRAGIQLASGEMDVRGFLQWIRSHM